MGFFTKRHKNMAKYNSTEELQNGYKSSESALRLAAYAGDMKALKNAMKVHGDYEYAMLYKKTPEYHKNK